MPPVQPWCWTICACLFATLVCFSFCETGRALVIVGIDENVIFINDPAQDKPALGVPSIEFEAAWIEQDLRYAVVRFQPLPAPVETGVCDAKPAEAG